MLIYSRVETSEVNREINHWYSCIEKLLSSPAVIADIAVPGLVLFSAVFLHFVFPHSLKGFLFYIQASFLADHD